MIYFLYIISVIASFYLWSLLHEGAHILTMKRYRPDANVKIKLYPHWEGKQFRWAAFEATYLNELSDREKGWVDVAPRIPDTIGVILTTILIPFLDGTWYNVALIMLGGSVVDLIYGSIGYTSRSDLRKAAEAWSVSPWVFRIGGFVLAAVPIATLAIKLLS